MKNNKILNSVVVLHFDKPTYGLDIQSKDLRGAIAGLYPNEILLHQHYEDGLVKYRYPLVQYKYINKRCLIIGIEAGAKLLNDLSLVGKTILLFNDKYRIIKRDILFQEVSFGITETILSYSFLTPWLALKEKNYEQYQKLGTWQKRKALLEKILIGNLLSISKSLGYTVPEPIKVDIINLKEIQTSLKGTPMLGFLGTFTVNFEIPDYWGIGKSVSRGFGTVKKIN
ncbi:CRISPR-associated endonuclease Cas6 [Thermodesulfovibrio hydrogeniphilus]